MPNANTSQFSNARRRARWLNQFSSHAKMKANWFSIRISNWAFYQTLNGHKKFSKTLFNRDDNRPHNCLETKKFNFSHHMQHVYSKLRPISKKNAVDEATAVMLRGLGKELKFKRKGWTHSALTCAAATVAMTKSDFGELELEDDEV